MTRFEPTLDSLRAHEVPAWFEDAKLGVMIQWGPSSVPGWAPKEPFYNVLVGEITRFDPDDELWKRVRALDQRPAPPEVIADIASELGRDEYAWALRRCAELGGWEAMDRYRAYAEWYQHTLAIADSPTARWHAQTYGDRPYEAFGQDFAEASADWDPAPWAELFAHACARYVVPITKHHDGYTLWPSEVPNLNREGWSSPRDLMGDLAEAVRARDIRFATYYSGGIDWTFDTSQGTPEGETYARYADAHFRELIDRYAPDVLWNDIAWPADADELKLFADYYNANADGVVDDRFRPRRGRRYGDPTHWDFRTPEYATLAQIPEHRWECVRALGLSFGYNRLETDEDLVSVPDLVHMLCDVVSKNGNLLIDVGPMADGTIPEIHAARLRGLGDWLRIYGDAIFGTRPWTRAEGETSDRTPVRFTRRDDDLFAIVLGEASGRVVIRDLQVEASEVEVLGSGPVGARRTDDGLALDVGSPSGSPAYAVRIGAGAR